METSGYFEFIKPAAFLEDSAKVGLKASRTRELTGLSSKAGNKLARTFLFALAIES
jgi:hypothetical protein